MRRLFMTTVLGGGLASLACYSTPSTEGKPCQDTDACSSDEVCVIVVPGTPGVCTPQDILTTTGLETSGLTAGDDGLTTDAGDGTGDSGMSDGGMTDSTDGGMTDGGTTSTTDGGTTDSTDGGTTDTGTTDTGTTTTDTGTTTTDTGTTDTGTTGGGLPNGTNCSFDSDCASGFCWPPYDSTSQGPGTEVCQAACIPVSSDPDWCLETSDCCSPATCNTTTGFCE